MHTHEAKPDVTSGAFEDREHAETAIVELRRLGLTDADIGILVYDPTRYVPVDETIRAALRGIAAGIAVGGPLGSIGGVELTALILPGVGVFGLGGLLLGVHDGAIWGAVLGRYRRLVARVLTDARREHWCEIPLNPGDILIVARAGEQTEQACAILERHGARCVLEPIRGSPLTFEPW